MAFKFVLPDFSTKEFIQYLCHIMALVLVVFLFFLQPILSYDGLSKTDHRKINNLKTITINEHNYRKKVYLENVAKIKAHNEKFKKGLVSYRMVMNQFGHLTEKEFAARYSQSHYNNRDDTWLKAVEIYESPKNVTLPAYVDWRLQNAVTPVKNQGPYCRSCYIFAAVAAIESHYFIKYKKLVTFSEQQVLDCGNTHFGKGACESGGYPHKVNEYVRDVGLTTDEWYPYEYIKGSCRIKNHPIEVKLQTYKVVKLNSVGDVKAAIAFRGPVSASLNSSTLQLISGDGILTGNWCSSYPGSDHIVTLIGYNTLSSGISYWIIKNTWGTRWGDNGYFYVEITEEDICGISQFVVIPYVN